MTRATPCDQKCNQAVLADHLRGVLPDESERRVVTHLDHCETCQGMLEMLGAGDTHLLHTARKAREEPPPSGVEMEVLLGKLTALHEPACTASWPAGDIVAALAPPEQAGEIGRLGHYAILDLLGQGGMGVVFKAHDQRLQRVVAVKALLPRLAADAAARERFLREARAAAAIRHDHVVGIHAVEDDAEPPYLVMEFIPGGSLAQRLKQGGPLELKQIVRLGAQVARGLAAAHAAGVIHRDIKPANVLLEDGLEHDPDHRLGRAKLTDFGLACAAKDAGATNGVIAGTPQYMAPEQARGETVDLRADLYSLGSLLYTLCTGREPFEGDTLAVVREVQARPPRPVRELNPHVPQWLEAIITKLHAPKPADRFASASEVAETLGRHLAEMDPPTNKPTDNASDKPMNTPAATPPRDRRRGAMDGVRMALAGVLVTGVAVLAWASWSGLLSRNGVPAGPAADIWPPKVLLVLPSSDFYFPDYNTMQTQLEKAGVTCVMAAPTLDDVSPAPLAPGMMTASIKPDVRIASVKAADYSAIYFGGGAGMAEYFDDGPQASEARRLIHEALAARRLVAAHGTGPRILADAGVLKGVRATCFQLSQPPGFLVATLQRAGAVTVDEPVVADGLFITGRDPVDMLAFVAELRKQLGVP